MKSVSFLLLSSWLLLLLLCIEFDGALGSERTKLTSSDRVQDRNKFLSGVQRDLDVLEQDIIRVETKENIGRKKKKWDPHFLSSSDKYYDGEFDTVWDGFAADKHGDLMDLAKEFVPKFDSNRKRLPNPSSDNTLLTTGFWNVHHLLLKDGADLELKTSRYPMKAIFDTLERHARLGWYILYFAESKEACSFAIEAYAKGTTDNAARFSCTVVPFDSLPFEKEANAISPDCMTKFHMRPISPNVLKTYIRIWLAKVFFTAVVAGGDIPPKFQHVNFDYFGWVDAAGHMWGGMHYTRSKTLIDVLSDTVDLAMPSMAVAISPYTQPTTVSNQNMTYIQWLSTEPDWRVSHKNVKNMFGGGPECGEPMIIARLFYGTGKAIVRLYSEYVAALSHIYEITKRNVKSGKGCKCFDEEMILATVFVRCPECFYVVP